MSDDDEIIKVRINTHLVGWYLDKQLKELTELKRKEDREMGRLLSPLDAKTVEDILRFAAAKKNIKNPLNNRLKAYKKSFGDDEPLTLDDVYSYFRRQLIFLNKKEAIDRLIVELANTEYQRCIIIGELKKGEKGEALFEPQHPSKTIKTVYTTNLKDDSAPLPSSKPPKYPMRKTHQSTTKSTDPVNFEKTNTKPSIHSELNANAVSFMPKEMDEMSKEKFIDNNAIIKPRPIRAAIVALTLIEDKSSIISYAEEPWEKAILPPKMLQTDAPFEHSRLYRFWTQTPFKNQEDSTPIISQEANKAAGLTISP